MSARGAGLSPADPERHPYSEILGGELPASHRSGSGRGDPASPGSDAAPLTPHPATRFDFRRLDLDGLWRGRERITEVERGVIQLGLAGANPRRLLEVGIGRGRITPVLRRWTHEYVGIDATPDFLRNRGVREVTGDRILVADVERLPFPAEAFSAVVMVRVFDFLPHPRRALSEIFRVLSPGGRAVISFYPWPSTATYVEQIRRRIRPVDGSLLRSLGRAGADWQLPSSHDVRVAAREAGFGDWNELGVGWEDFRPLRRLPAKVFVALSGPAGRAGVGPHRFVSLGKPENA